MNFGKNGTEFKNLELKINNNYCLDIIDHFSKWEYSYLLEDKTMFLVISKIKLFIMNFGKCKIFKMDNLKI